MVNKKPENNPAYLKVTMVARDLNLSRRSVRRLLESGQLPGFRLGGLWMIPAREYFAYIEKLKNDAIETFLATSEAKRKEN